MEKGRRIAIAVAVSVVVVTLLTLQQQQEQMQEQIREKQLQTAIAIGQAEFNSYTCEQLFNYIANEQRLGSSMEQAQQAKQTHAQDLYLSRCQTPTSH